MRYCTFRDIGIIIVTRREAKSRGAERGKTERVEERKRKRERRHIDVHAFRLVHICNANLRGDRGARVKRRTEEGEMDGGERGGGESRR